MKDYIIYILVVCSVLLGVAVSKFAMRVREQKSEIEYLKREVKESYLENDYEHWCCELFCAKMQIIPFMSRKTAKKMYKKLKMKY